MTIATTSVGHVEVTALLDGISEDLPLVESFPGAPPDPLLAERTRYPGVYGGAGDRWRMIVRAWLVRHPGGEMLVDTGVGSTVAMEWFPEPGRLVEAVAEAGSDPHRIDTVVITHTHDDHVGGTVTADGTPVFPNARHVIQAAELQAARTAGTASDADDEDAAIWRTLLAPLEAAGMFDVVGGDVEITDALGLHHTPGHTPGHQVLRVASEGSRMMIAGDAWTHPSQLAHPEWANAADGDPDLAADTRRSLLAGLQAHPGTIVAPTHFAEPFGRIVSDRDGLAAWEPVA